MERHPQVECSLTHGFPYWTSIEGDTIKLPQEAWEPFANPHLRLEVCFTLRLGDLFDYPHTATQPVLQEMVSRIGPITSCGEPINHSRVDSATYRQSRQSLDLHGRHLSDEKRDLLLGGTATTLLQLC